MDSGPFSTPQPADRRAASRPEQTYRPKEPQPVAEEPARVAHRPPVVPRGGKEKRSFKRFIMPLVIVILIVLIGVGGWMFWSLSQNKDSAINKDEYQAVILSNGQVYVGKLASYNNTYLKLTDAFIAVSPNSSSQSNTASQKDSASTDSVQLLRVTNTILGPHDAMFVERSQVVLYENLQPNGKAAKLIKQYNGQ